MLCVHAGVLLANLAILPAHLSYTLVHVLEVDAEDVVFDDLRVVVLDYVLVL